MRKINLLMILLGWMTACVSVCAGPLTAGDEETDEQSALFTGVRFQQGSTTLVDGTELGINPAAPYGSGLEAGDLSQFERQVFSVSDANGTFTMSERPRRNEDSGSAVLQTGPSAGLVFSGQESVHKTKTYITAHQESPREN